MIYIWLSDYGPPLDVKILDIIKTGIHLKSHHDIHEVLIMGLIREVRRQEEGV